MSELYLLRHGETAGRSSVRFYGSTDVPLSALGEEQMRRAGGALAGVCFRTVVTSPMRRSRESACIVLNGRTADLVVVEDFREIDFGDWEGLTDGEIAERHPELYRVWRIESRLLRFPGGDSREEFRERVMRAAGAVFGNIQLPALAVLHKGVIRCILCELLGVPYSDMSDRRIELGSIHRLRKTAGGWVLLEENVTGHLGEYRMENS